MCTVEHRFTFTSLHDNLAWSHEPLQIMPHIVKKEKDIRPSNTIILVAMSLLPSLEGGSDSDVGTVIIHVHTPSTANAFLGVTTLKIIHVSHGIIRPPMQ